MVPADPRKAHWESVHAESDADDVSWYQDEPRLSLALLERAGVMPDARVLDVGCGASGIAGPLLERGFTHVHALDLAGHAIERAKTRLGAAAARVTWHEADVLSFRGGPFDVWHDRAVFHFFTSPADQRAYVDSLRANVAPGGHVVLATFAPDGPETCSGLPVARHDATSLKEILGAAFRLTHEARESHVTPWDTEQRFTWTLFQKKV